MNPQEAEQAQTNLRLRAAIMRWAACLAIFGLLAFAGLKLNSSLFGNLAFFFYIWAGFYMSRSVLKKMVEWHPMYNTLQNVTSTKLKFLLLWPVAYVALFIRLGVNKIL